ncbi:MAG: energy transducer TonB [Gemmatimonadetes bacterium]|uniref:Energy transducer TonB n=1 Tax=Candidatus Kutchimonas denitrificans TaxID=3056748 RepID=A0AAE4Z6J2_9BACT|nr:energy transducer TonB [Gemmatimonadota bacterium]NIR74513.1 energy transducer TonB [Candidatus Kutchimonas denitrificans]NIS02703.1 energy transducer TonB [Gemmatimonadota bacterium]NIT68864.1 energy transducer TonB [Gemmatimonadota bacterium]NIU52169.1 TonB family protein [Gemmatimonadota bacterium]
MAEKSAEEKHAYHVNANDRFKRSAEQWLYGGIIVATVFHFGLFKFFPELTASDVSFGVNEFEAIELPPEVDIPPPPEQISRPAVPVVAAAELEEDITIAPTTFEENPVENLPPPPSDASRLGDQPVFTPMEVRPELKNSREIQRLLDRLYPKMLKDAGIGGTVQVYVFIDTEGNVQNAQVNESSGYEALDQAALEAAYQLRFSPALNRDKKVPVWISQNITFSVTG